MKYEWAIPGAHVTSLLDWTIFIVPNCHTIRKNQVVTIREVYQDPFNSDIVGLRFAGLVNPTIGSIHEVGYDIEGFKPIDKRRIEHINKLLKPTQEERERVAGEIITADGILA